MALDLQSLVDSLGERLGRSVVVDDASLRLLAYSAHSGAVDNARLISILQRGLAPDGVEYLLGLGILNAGSMFKVPAKADLGFTIPRIGFPIRFDDDPLGFVWLLESEGSPDASERAILDQAVDALALLLHRRALLGEIERGRERELTRSLISDDRQLRAEAAASLVEEELLVARPVSVLIVTLSDTDETPLTERDRLAITMGLALARRRLPPRYALQLERPDHGVLIVAMKAYKSQPDLHDLAVLLHGNVVAESGCPPDQCCVGIGEQHETLTDAHSSYLEARRAAAVARVTHALGSVVHYQQLGIYRLLSHLSRDQLQDAEHQGLRRLREHDKAGAVLISTLEAFLDNAGGIKRTAEQLKIQPTSLYYRLRRIEEIAQVDLNSGEDRLALHQSLKIARLIARK